MFFENTSGVVHVPEPTAARSASLGEDAANYSNMTTKETYQKVYVSEGALPGVLLRRDSLEALQLVLPDQDALLDSFLLMDVQPQPGVFDDERAWYPM